MQKSNYLLRNFNVINTLLLVIIIILAFLVVPLFTRPVTFVPPVAEKSDEATAESSSEEGKTPLESEYDMIAEQNLFHPERRLIVGQLEETEADEGHEFVLYGVLVTDDMSIAYLEDVKSPVESPGRGKRQTALKRGDTLNGFTLEEIGTDQVVMVRGDERIVVPISDPDNPKEREVPKETKAVASKRGEEKKSAQRETAATKKATGRERDKSSGAEFSRTDIKKLRTVPLDSRSEGSRRSEPGSRRGGGLLFPNR